MKILLPLDGSLVSETALRMAAGLARSRSAEILVVRVVDPHAPLPAGAFGMAQQLHQVEHESATDYLERIARDLTHWGLQGSTEVRVGQPSAQIVKAAREKHADLIVMASHGRSGPGRWLIGSVAESVLRQSPCPVLLCRGRMTEEFRGFERVIVPVDGSAGSNEALLKVQPFLAPGARVVLVRATDTLVRLSALRLETDTYQTYLEALQQELDALEPALPCVRRVLDAPPSEAILAVAEEERADLIAMSTHGRTGTNRILVGSVTERVARHAECPVLAFPTRLPVSGLELDHASASTRVAG